MLNAPDRSTIIVYKGKNEIGRVVWFVPKQEIEQLLMTALSNHSSK